MTKKVTCSLPNASEEINGVPFARVGDVMVADGVDDEDAALFDGIPGYQVEDAAGEPAAVTTGARRGRRSNAEIEAAKAAEAAAVEHQPEATATAETNEGE